MKPGHTMAWWALALGATIIVAPDTAAWAQQAAPAICNDFVRLREDAQKKAAEIQAANGRHAERKEVCNLVTRFASAEAGVVKFLKDNKSWCGIPDQIVTQAKTNHDRTMKFRTMVCAEAPEAKPKVPTLSDAIRTPSVDTEKNTRLGRGTFDTLTGNPLAK